MHSSRAGRCVNTTPRNPTAYTTACSARTAQQHQNANAQSAQVASTQAANRLHKTCAQKPTSLRLRDSARIDALEPDDGPVQSTAPWEEALIARTHVRHNPARRHSNTPGTQQWHTVHIHGEGRASAGREHAGHAHPCTSSPCTVYTVPQVSELSPEAA